MADSRQFVKVMASKRVPMDHKLVKVDIKRFFMSGGQVEIADASSNTNIPKRRRAFNTKVPGSRPGVGNFEPEARGLSIWTNFLGLYRDDAFSARAKTKLAKRVGTKAGHVIRTLA